MSQRTVEDTHSCVYCLKVYDDSKIIGHLKEWHILRDDVEKEIAKFENKINKKRSAPPSSSCHGQQNRNSSLMPNEDHEFRKCQFCKSSFDGDSKLRGLYEHVKIAHPDQKRELNILAVKIAHDEKRGNGKGLILNPTAAIQTQMDKAKMIEPEPVNPLSIYEKCSFCSSTFIGLHTKTNFYLHIKTNHPFDYQGEWEKLLKIEKAIKRNPDIVIQNMQDPLLQGTTTNQNNLLTEQSTQMNNRTNVKLEKNHNGQTIIENTLNCGPKIFMESDLPKVAKTQIGDLIDVCHSNKNNQTKRRISHYNKLKAVPSDSDKLAEVKNVQQTTLPNASTNNVTLLTTDEEKEKTLIIEEGVSDDKSKSPAKTTNKANQPKKKQQKKPKQPAKKRRKKRKRLIDIGNVSDSQSSDYEPEIKKMPSKIIKPQENTAPKPDSESKSSSSATTESKTTTQPEIDDIETEPDPPVKLLRKRVKPISYDTDKYDLLEDDSDPQEIKKPRKIISKSVPPNCNYCKVELPERTEKSYVAHLSSGSCKGITIKKREAAPIPERKDSLKLEDCKFTCSICSQMFMTCTGLEEHISFEHYKYKCDYCIDKRFVNIINMSLHMELAHNEIIPPPYTSLLLTKKFCKSPILNLKKIDSALGNDESMVRKYFNYIYNVLISTNTKESKIDPEMETICKVCGELVKFNTRDLKELKLHCLVHDPISLSIETCFYCKRKVMSREQYMDHLKINHKNINFNANPDLFSASSNTNPAKKLKKLPKIIKPRLIKYHENSSESENSSFGEDSETGSDTDFEGNNFDQDSDEILVRLCHVCGITISDTNSKYHFNLHDFSKMFSCICCDQRFEEECELKDHQNNCKLNPKQSDLSKK